MGKPKVYITSRSFGQFSEEALKLINSVAEVERNPYGRAMTEEELLKAVKDADGLIVGNDKINKKVIEHAEKLKIIARHGVGVDNVDLKAATDNNIIVTYTPNVNADAVADFTMGLIFSLARNIPQAYVSLRQGKWEATKFMGVDVHGKTLGIIGLGEIGYRVAKRARGFDMKILYWSRNRKGSIEKELSVQYVDLQTLLRESDFVTIHLALTDETRGMIGKKELDLMKKTAYLINTARGPIVDEKALYEALKEGKIAGAAVDVYEKEPPDADNPLLRLDNVIATPHVAAYSRETMQRMDMMNAEDILRFFKGEQPQNVANPEVLKKLGLRVKS
ncbi:MAG: phosphoglycerate dehydrogenase [Nitrososphaerota archaeon]|nr:phosphoglycerate dehydrogenase [Candidatus Bathyarchaeota archaeon]MDW8022892.1 phosphoglycerate dehydrogenase [Nitrososphaerota archaeon]